MLVQYLFVLFLRNCCVCFCQLSEIKSTDKTMTLLRYLEQFIASRYPHIYDFYEEIVLNMDRGG